MCSWLATEGLSEEQLNAIAQAGAESVGVLETTVKNAFIRSFMDTFEKKISWVQIAGVSCKL